MTNTQQSKARFVLTFPLRTDIHQEHIIEKKYKIATHIQNALIRGMKKNINRLRQDKAYRHWISQPSSKERTQVLKERRETHGVTESWLEQEVKNMQKHFRYTKLTKTGKQT